MKRDPAAFERHLWLHNITLLRNLTDQVDSHRS